MSVITADSQQPEGPKVSFLIVNWNVREYIVPCVKSIVATTPKDLPIEIIIVDNASTDGARDYLPRECPEARLIFSDENLGYGRANNLAFEHARGEYVFVLNPDTEMTDSSWAELVRILDDEPQTGIAGPKIFLSDGSIQQTSARRADRLLHCILFELVGLNRTKRYVKKGLMYRYAFYPPDEDRYVEAVSGAAMLVRRELYAGIKGFDPEFLHGGEDVFFCTQCRELGYRIKFVEGAHLNHYHNKSGAKASVRTYVRSLDSRYVFFRKVAGRFSAFVFRSCVLAFYCLRLFIVAASATLFRRTNRQESWKMLSSVLAWCLFRRIP